MQELRIATTPAGRLGKYVLGFGQDLQGEMYVVTKEETGPRERPERCSSWCVRADSAASVEVRAGRDGGRHTPPHRMPRLGGERDWNYRYGPDRAARRHAFRRSRVDAIRPTVAPNSACATHQLHSGVDV